MASDHALEIPEPDPGEIVRDYVEVFELPTGTPEEVPVIVANGEEDGKTLWLTGAIHGDEATGMAVCQDVIHEDLPGHLDGRVVSLPNINPAGLRRNERTSYYDGDDPNRKFPGREYVVEDHDGPADYQDGSRPPGQQAIICRRIFEAFRNDADALLDVHTASANAHPFVIKDRVLYDRGEEEDDSIRGETKAEELAEDVEKLADEFGLPVMFEYVPEEYEELNFDKSVAGSALNQAGIPAITLELGAHDVVEDEWLAQGIAGTYRVMEHLGMFDDKVAAAPDDLGDGGSFPEPIRFSEDEAYTDIIEFPVRRHVGPHADGTGIVRHHVEAGDAVEAGEVIAEIVPPDGDPDDVEEVEAEGTGWIIQREEGIATYEKDALTMMTVEDDGETTWSPEED